MDEFVMRPDEAFGSMTGASPVTTTHGIAWRSHVHGQYSSDRACPCHALDDLFFPHSNLNHSYPDM
ncbi:MAG: hypothetical protein NVS4B11_15100 [Ktedonobacteraceae bacterium]